MPFIIAEWVVNPKNTIIECSNCKHEAYWDTDYGQQLFDYCPYCGCKMKIHKDDFINSDGRDAYAEVRL